MIYVYFCDAIYFDCYYIVKFKIIKNKKNKKKIKRKKTQINLCFALNPKGVKGGIRLPQ